MRQSRSSTFDQATLFPASSNQFRYVMAELSGVGAYMIAVGHMVEGSLDKEAFHVAVRQLVERHDALRTAFVLDGRQIHASVSTDAKFQFHQCEMEDQSLAAFREWALPASFDAVDTTEHGSLIRFFVADYGSCWRFSIAAHHAIMDGLSRRAMHKDLLKLYVGEELEPAKSYYDYALPHVRDASTTDEVERFVEALPKPARLVSDGSGKSGLAQAGKFVEKNFGSFLKDIRPLGKAIGASKFGVLSACHALGMYGFTGSSDVATFFQTEGRGNLGAPASVIGPFSNTLPLDVTVDLDKNFAAFAKELTQQTKLAISLETEPILDSTLAAGKGPTVSINMYPPSRPIRAGSLQIGPREFLDRRIEFDLNLVWADDRNVTTGRVFFDSAHVSKARAASYLDFQGRLLASVLENADRTCREILAAARIGHEAVTHASELEPEPTTRLHESFFELAQKQPDAPAVITSRETITYEELADRALRFMKGVVEQGVGEGDTVGILAGRDPAIIAAILGISASGASFALLDATYPDARLKKMIDRLGARLIVEAGAAFPKAIQGNFTIVREANEPVSSMKPVGGPPRDAAYHLFTSGTTGEAKLISLPDKTLQRSIAWQIQKLSLSEPITTVLLAGISHDPTLRDIFLPLCSGGRAIVPTNTEMVDPKSLRHLIRSAKCSVLNASASSSRLVSAGLSSNEEGFPDILAIFWGSERLSAATVEHWRDLSPHARQFNIFGTTETPQIFLCNEILAERHKNEPIPLGQPLPYSGVRIVDPDGVPVSVGEVGEIVADLADPVSGVNQKVQPDHPQISALHFTGDLGYQMPDGNVRFVGRQDDQVTINGFRVELAGIEAVAESISGVERACALLSEEKLLLFILTDDLDVNEGVIRTALAKNLPSYMVPSEILLTNDFPLTANNKVDKAGLLKLKSEKSYDPIDPASAPETEDERMISAIFTNFSGRDALYRNQSFFDLGADSLTTIEARLALEHKGILLPEDWQWVSIADLALLNRSTATSNVTRNPFFSTSTIETMILFRALAIVGIVIAHNGFQLGIGSTVALFALAGFSFAQLQLPTVLKDDHVGRVVALLGRIYVPLVLFFLLHAVANTLRGEDVHVTSQLLHRNFAPILNHVFPDHWNKLPEISWVWFLHTYIQIFALIGFMLAFPWSRERLRDNTWSALLVVSLVSLCASILAVSGIAVFTGDFREIAIKLQTVPTTIFPFLAIGALAVYSKTPMQRVVTLALGVLYFGICKAFFPFLGNVSWIIVLVVCMILPHIVLPRLLTRVIVPIAAFSLMIYLTHIPVMHLLRVFLGTTPAAITVIVPLQILIGIGFGLAMRPVLRALGVDRLSTMKVSLRRQETS